MQLKKEWVIPASVGVASFTIGIGVGYVLTSLKEKKARIRDLEAQKAESHSEDGDSESQSDQLRFEFEERTQTFNHMIQEAAHVVRQFTDRGHEYLNGMIASLEETETLPQSEEVEEMESILLSKSYHPSNQVHDNEVAAHSDEEANVVNIFAVRDETWDYEVELANRSPEKPYIIHRDEYFSDEMGYSQTTITWYDGDHILCDEDDAPIYNPEKIVGELKFGHGSNDPNVVYIRNEVLGAEYEVLFDGGHYLVEVLGQHIDDELAAEDLKHAKGVLRFRPE
jgi:hypothetical protein